MSSRFPTIASAVAKTQTAFPRWMATLRRWRRKSVALFSPSPPLQPEFSYHGPKLDYCNSLSNGLPKSSINRLQVVQNSLARMIYLSAKWSDHVSPLLHKLHWLPVSSRLEFKIVTLTFKVLKFQQSAYIYDLIAPRSLRSSNKNLLIVPDIRSEMGRRSFPFAAPTIWNSSDSLSAFRGLLKTFLYQKSLPP